ncbi:flagellar basal-body rod protein FlgB [Silvibacterium bohemicum]|uniref:Flagellar basal body rod protein FlgB n=1 Tax=Silvibacterium bohemicum TaxID=1577686 RepID=A0A841K0Z2_9BACT|nr:flagellar basal body rod protein FlgB [Silvibacterium bohemicum]MBB6147216.1 flagellar basal-body rod protein FlgB [Silvibacterium bohemicum]
MQITTSLTDQLASYLDLSSLELKLTAQNMANIDTPGYRTMGIDFGAEMERSIAAVIAERRREEDSAGNLSLTSKRAAVEKVDGLLERPDGNNVSMDREGMKMAEAQLQFRAGVELLKHEVSTILDAIHADSK